MGVCVTGTINGAVPSLGGGFGHLLPRPSTIRCSAAQLRGVLPQRPACRVGPPGLWGETP